MNPRQLLAQLGALPKADDSAPKTALPDQSIPDVLFELWTVRRNSTSGAAQKKAERILTWLRKQSEQRAAAELVSGSREKSLSESIGDRILWWPNGKPAGRRIAIVSSRIGRNYESRPEWFETLRLASGTLETNDQLVTSDGLTTHPFVSQLSEMMSVPFVDIQLAPARRAVSRWFDWLIENADAERTPNASPVFVSPAIHRDEHLLPDRDLIVSQMADQLWILSLRRTGSLAEILFRRLKDSTFAPGSVRLLCGNGLVSEELARPLQELGAVCWYLTSKDTEAKSEARPSTPICPAGSTARGIEDLDESEWLTHCTRKAALHVSAKAEAEQIEKLVLSEANDCSPFESLLRIVSEGRLRASSEGIRGDFSVVCFSARSLSELLSHRTWQKHRTRWDFEPYGICLRKESLRKLGAGPVKYGNDDTWTQLAEEKRAWFQKSESQIGDRIVDWTKEMEWRTVGDIELTQFGSADAFAFVPTQEEAAKLQPHCRWPVRVVSHLK